MRSYTIDGSIRNEIKDLSTYYCEAADVWRDEGKYSVLDVVDIESKRCFDYDENYLDTLFKLKGFNEEIEDIRIAGSYIGKEPYLYVVFSSLFAEKNGMLSTTVDYRYTNKGLIGMDLDYSYKILETCGDILKDFMKYATDNNYCVPREINTISNLFKVTLNNSKTTITMPSNLLYNLDKRFVLVTNCEDFTKGKNDKVIGNYILNTNIRGVKRLFTKGTDENRQVELINKFLNNLNVYESDIPEYLKDIFKKEKVLRK